MPHKPGSTMSDWTDILNEVVASTADITNDVERIKAILLHENQCGSTALIYKNKIADEWDDVERRLRYDAFWTYINPNPDAPRYWFSRMTFVFDMLLRCEKEENGEYVDLDARMSRNKHYLFDRCLSVMMNPEIKTLPFLPWDITLSNVMKEKYPIPVAVHEISHGMMMLWYAAKSLFEQMWHLFYCFVINEPMKCITTEFGDEGESSMRVLLSLLIEDAEEDLDENDEEDNQEDEYSGMEDWR